MIEPRSERDLFFQILKLVRPHWWRLSLAMSCMGLVAAATAGVAYMVKPLLDEVFIARDMTQLKIVPALVLTVYLLKGGFFFGQSYLMSYVGLSIVNDLRVRLYAHMQSLSLSFFHRNSTGVLISRITNDVGLIQSAVSNFITGAVMDFFSIIGLVSVLFYRDWALAVFGLVVIPLAVYPIYYFGRRLRSLAYEGQEVMAELTTILSETIQGARIVKAFNMEDLEIRRFAAESKRRFINSLRTVAVDSFSSPFMESLGGLCLAGIIWYGGYQVILGRSTPGSFFSFMTALLMLYEPIKRLTRLNSAIQQGLTATRRIYEILDLKPEIEDKPGALDMPPIVREIEFSDVYYGYEAEDVLKGINLKVAAGEVLAIVGVSGGGKTTLVNLIPRFYDVRQGAILIDGQDIRDITLKSLRAQIGIVSQNVILFNDTVKNNISYGCPTADEQTVFAAARSAYAYDFITDMTESFNTVIGERGVRLSGGERQRLAIARALLKNAPILILDEATSALDSESELAVQGALENLMQGRTTLVIAHRLSTVRHADRIIVIAGGRIIEEGNHEALMTLNGEYRRLYEIQFRTESDETITAQPTEAIEV